MTDRQLIQNALDEGIRSGVATAVALCASRGADEAIVWYSGHHRPNGEGEACGPNSIFDLASLTKPLTMGLHMLRLASTAELDLRAPIGEYLTVKSERLSRVPVWRLLVHESGLEAHREYFAPYMERSLNDFDFATTRREIECRLSREQPFVAPQIIELYSDLGFMVLRAISEAIGHDLREGWSALPGHGPDALHFRALPAANGDPKYVATENCLWRRRLLQGQVHDDNAWAMGGVCGHAGLFGTLSSVYSAAREWAKCRAGEPNDLGISHSVVTDAFIDGHLRRQGNRFLAWDRRTPGKSTSGQYFSAASYGHLGFTGTSIWNDPVEDITVVLLTNRVCPTRDNTGIRQFRPMVHDLVRTLLVGG